MPEATQWKPELRRWLDQAALAAGFDLVGIAVVSGTDHSAAAQDALRFEEWVNAGHAGEMEYLKRRNQQGTLIRANLRVAMPWARSAIICAINYNFAASSKNQQDRQPHIATPLSIDPAPPESAWIARYAWTGHTHDNGSCAPTDYHDELLIRLRQIESELLLRTDCTTRCYVDTGPLLERSIAAEAGIGWIGKNTCLINQSLGSWLLLGVIVSSLPIEEYTDKIERKLSTPEQNISHLVPSEIQASIDINNVTVKPIARISALDRCGSCTRCIDACPTGALLGSNSPEAPRTMDASRCIAYLTIEKKGSIHPTLHSAMGRQVFGCDICQDVCPWNRKASIPARQLDAGVPSSACSERFGWESMQPRPELINPALDWLAAMDARQFKRLFKGSPLERTGRKRLLRNVAIAMGNSREARFLPQLEAWAAGDDPVLADAAAWARTRLLAL